MRRLQPWLPELALLVCAFVLRATMVTRFAFWRGYDFESHWKYVDWMTQHLQLPHGYYSRSAYQPPLFYAVIGLLRRFTASDVHASLPSVIAGCLRFVVLELGLVALFPSRRLLRCVALAIAAVLPAALHLDGMINPEAFLGLFTSAFVLCAYLALSAEGRARRWAWWLGAGAFASLALLTRISVTAAIGAVGVAALIDAARAPLPWRARLVRLAPFAAALALVAATTGWYFAHNIRAYGKPLLTGYDFRERDVYAPVAKIPMWQRRNLGYVFGWTTDIYDRPAWPSGYQPVPRFFPVLVASTFSDYYRYGFQPDDPRLREMAGTRDHTAWQLAKLSVAAGTIIALVTVAAWLGALVAAWRRRRAGELALVLVPLAGVAGQLMFAWQYAIDWEGPVKGVYLQFAALPLCGLFGLAVDWSWQRRRWRAVAVVALAALLAVAVFTVYARFASPHV